MVSQNTPDAFKALILSKYPDGVSADGTRYSDMSAQDLTSKIVSKYPDGVTSAGIAYKAYLTPPAPDTSGNRGNVPSIFDTIKNAAAGGVQQFQTGMQQAAAAKTPFGTLRAGLNEGVGALGVLTSPIAPLLSPLGAMIQSAAEPISNIPAVQKFATSPVGQGTAIGAEVLSNTATLLGTVGGGVEKVPGAYTGLKSKVLPNPEQAFNTNLNKALPVLKNDVRNLPAKQKAARTALGDIVANKEKLGLTDSQGLPRNPANFTETTQAQAARLKSIYTDYTSRLSTVDKTKFETDIHDSIFKQIDETKAQLAKENSLDGRKALSKIQAELSSLRDVSPTGIQNYIEHINQVTKTAPGHPWTPLQVKYINLGGDMRKVLDASMGKIQGQGYQDLRNTYGAHKALESQFLMAAKKEINNTPGLSEKLANLGVTIEGINFLLTHDPHALTVAAGTKVGLQLWKHFTSPQSALGRLYKQIEREGQSSQPKSSTAQSTKPSAIKPPSNTIP